jgi:YD repeat-containing protein
MKTMIAMALTAIVCCTVHAGDAGSRTARLTTRFDQLRPSYVFEDGKLTSSSMPRARGRSTKYEYNGTQLTRKTLPNGTTVDYYYSRDGKLVETRFSTGLVRTLHYDRKTGNLAQIVGSDGYSLTLGYSIDDPKATPSLIVTGPKNYRLDLTSKLQSVTTKAILNVVQPRGNGKSAVAADGGGGGFCGGADYGSDYCDWGGGGDGGGAEGGSDASGEGDGNAGEGGDAGAAGTGWDAPGQGDGEGDKRADDRMAYERCMASICDPADTTFRRLCNAEPANKRAICHDAADREYWSCERGCR